MQETRGGLDDCGVKYLLSHKIFSFLKRSLPPSDRPQTMSSFDIAWAMHSEAGEWVKVRFKLPNRSHNHTNMST